MASPQTGSNTISAHRTARNNIPTSTTLNTILNLIDLENMGIAVGILFVGVLELEIIRGGGVIYPI